MPEINDISSDKEMIFVVGIHRSGTSLLTSLLNNSGLSVGNQLLPPLQGVNDEGFWEDMRLVSLNEEILHENNMEWYHLNIEPIYKVGKNLSDKISNLLLTWLKDEKVNLIKDPRLCLTLPIWEEECKKLGIKTKKCVVERDSSEISASLQKRDQFPKEYCDYLVGKYIECLHKVTDKSESANVTYSDLLESPGETLENIGEKLDITLHYDDAIKKIIKPELRHHVKKQHNVKSYQLSSIVNLLSDQFVNRGRMISSQEEIIVKMRSELQCLQDENKASHLKDEETLKSTQKILDDLGKEHSKALSTINERDHTIKQVYEKLDSIGALHSHALRIVQQRDETIQLLNKQLELIGNQHTHALETIQKRDMEIALLGQKLKNALPHESSPKDEPNRAS